MSVVERFSSPVLNSLENFFNLNELTATPVRAPVALNATYYRSRAFTAHSGLNPLITAAQPFFSCFFELKARLNDNPNPEALLENIRHELKVFANHATTANYSLEVIALCEYLLCATLDDLLTLQRSTIDYPAFIQIFTPINNRATGDEQIIKILYELFDTGKSQLELVEFIFLCLQAGYLEEVQILPENSPIRDRESLLEELYDYLRIHREQNQQFLFLGLPPLPSFQVEKSYKSWWLFLGFILFIIGGAAGLLNYMLDLNSQSLSTVVHHIVNHLAGVG